MEKITAHAVSHMAAVGVGLSVSFSVSAIYLSISVIFRLMVI